MGPNIEVKMPIRQEGLRWGSSLILKVEGLLLVLVALSVTFEGVDDDDRLAIWAALFLYAAFILGIRCASFRMSPSRWITALETWMMIPFITWGMWFTDQLESPLRNAFLLVIVASALTLGMRITLCQLGLIAAAIVLLGETLSTETLFSLPYVSSLVTRLTPLVIFAYVTAAFSVDIRYGIRKAELLSDVDELTRLHTLRGFTIIVDCAFDQARRHNQPATLLVIDVDNFKSVNDAHGREGANTVLQKVAASIKTALRHNDVLARYDDDDFVALLPETPAAGALGVAERIRAAVAASSIAFGGAQLATSLSIGLASYTEDGSSCDAVFDRAHHAMRLAREQGGNKVVKFAV